MSITEFISIAKESNYNISLIFEKAPNETLLVLGGIVLIVLIILFLIVRASKISSAIKLIDEIKNTKTYEQYNEKFFILADELPKRGKKVLAALNTNKEVIFEKIPKFVEGLCIEEKIDRYLLLSKRYAKIVSSIAKYHNIELNSFYERKSKELLAFYLFDEIREYYTTTHYTVDEIENVNAIVKYANSLGNNSLILSPMIKSFDKFSFGYNMDLFRFIENLEENEAKEIYIYCKDKIKNLLNRAEGEISINILEYLYETKREQEVYDYISKLRLPTYLQQLYYLLFDKKDDMNLDLAFIANPIKIENNYKEYIDNSLTSNWRDEEYIDFISKSPGVIEVLGHDEYRKIIERIDKIVFDNENKKMIEEALETAKRAETLAIEVKELTK